MIIRQAPSVDPTLALDARTPYAELERQHELLRARLAALQKAAAAEGAVDGEELAKRVTAARSSLALHFSFEETVGTLSTLAGAYPAVQPEVERLRTEHAAFLTTLDRIAGKLRRDRTARDIGGILLSVLDRLVDHELDERQLYRVTLRSAPV